MELSSERRARRSISVFVRITPEMHEQLAQLAKRIRGGVSTLIRQICETGLVDGIKVVERSEMAETSDDYERRNGPQLTYAKPDGARSLKEKENNGP
jgi:predicted DNA-binding protein